MRSTHTQRELGALITALQMSQAQEAPASETQIVGSAFALDENV